MAERKRILFVVEAMGGGVFSYIVDLSNELIKSYDIFIAYSVRVQTPTNYAEFFDPRIRLIEVKSFTRSINLHKDLNAVFEVRRIAKEVKPDIIHLHSSKAGVIGRIAFNGRRVPLFYTPHGYSFLMENYATVKRHVFRAAEWICAKRNCTTISCSYGEHQETLKLTKRAVYANTGIDVESLNAMFNEIDRFDHPFTVFTLGRICFQKNPKLFDEIAKAMPNVNFMWIGDGEQKELLSAPNIEVTGWISRKEALQRSLNADVFMLTSLWEGLPVSLLEAMCMKKLCVVSDVIGNHDVIENGRNGYVCNSIEQFKKAIEQAPSSDQMIANAYRDVEQNFNIHKMAAEYSEIYGRYSK